MMNVPAFGEADGGMPATLIPAQKPPPKAALGDTGVNISSHPPLGQVTKAVTVPGQLTFVVCFEVHQSLAQKPWQVALSLSALGTSEWRDELLRDGTAVDVPISLRDPEPLVAQLYFSTSFDVHEAFRFTFKFRESRHLPWRPARDELRIQDGVVVSAAKGPLPHDIRDVFTGLANSVIVRNAMSQTPGTRLWVMDAPVAGLGGDESDRSMLCHYELGLPWNGVFLRWFALVRIWSPWLAPRHGGSHLALDEDAVMCAFLNRDGKHLVLLPVSGVAHVTATLRSDATGGLVLHLRSDSIADGTASVLAAAGDDFESTLAACVYHVRGMMQMEGEQSTSEHKQDSPRSLAGGVQPEWMEDWYDGLGFCTWNALGQRLTEDAVLGALDTLAKNEIEIRTLIIDDLWQDIDRSGQGQFQYGWNRFEAESDAFPHGLRALVSMIRSRHPHVKHVAVWHALLGYWGGISPGGEIARSYATVEVVREEAKRRNLPLGGEMTVVAKEDVDRFYDDFYRFLSSCGVDGVKCDAQFMIDTWIGATARRELADAYLSAWATASLRHFSNRAISCMSLTPHIMFQSQLPRNRPAIPLRNSDDFFPDIPASHPWHVWTNAHNSLFTQYLNVIPDWDMFQTSHSYSGLHAAARCVSGGPIYISDVPGQHDTSLIAQMTGVTPRGRTVIFRPSVVGRSIDHYVGYTDDSLLKVGSYHGAARTGTPILGVFNVALRPLTGIVPLDRFPGASPQCIYVVRAHTNGRVTPPIQPGSPSSLISVSLGVRGYEILTAFPLSGFESPTGGRLWVANLGLLGKMAGSAAVVSSECELTNGRIVLDTRVKALGVIGVYVSNLPAMDVGRDFIATIQGAVIPQDTVSISPEDAKVLAVDVESAWEKMALDSGWSNEVDLTLYVGLGNMDQTRL